MKTHYHTLSQVLLLEDRHQDLKRALTHSSFYKNAENTESEKLIFLGMYAFKGKVAEVLRKYMPFSGKQLQHYLGNIFKNKELDKIYSHYHLEHMVRYGKDFPIAEKRHLFVYALLGFMMEFAEEKYLLRFIYRNFLATTEHLLPTQKVNKDLRSKLIYMANMYYGKVPVFVEAKEGNQYHCCITIGEETLAESKGSNLKTVWQLCFRTAVREVGNALQKEWEADPIMQETERKLKKAEAERIAKEKAEKLKAYKAKQKKRSEEIAQEKQKRKALAIEKDIKRRKSKALAKKRREELEELRRRQKLEMANMSVAKRRHLQDKGLLSKGAPPKKK